MLNLNRRRTKVFRLEHILRQVKGLGRFPSQLAHRRLGVRNPQIGNDPLFLNTHIDAGFRLNRLVLVVFTGNGLILSVQFRDVLIFHIEDIPFAAIAVAFFDFLDLITADAQIKEKSDDGQTDHIGQLKTHIHFHGLVHIS